MAEFVEETMEIRGEVRVFRGFRGGFGAVGEVFGFFGVIRGDFVMNSFWVMIREAVRGAEIEVRELGF